MNHPDILVIDDGSQTTLLFPRLLGEEGHRAVVLSPENALKWLGLHTPKAVIFSGSGKSVYNQDAPAIPKEIMELPVPKLGVCYGMQYVAHTLGGAVEHDHESVEYGPATVLFKKNKLFDGLDLKQEVYASHGDSVTKLPKGARRIATDASGKGTRGMYVPSHQFWGVQFHPEVVQSPCGRQILLNFVEKIGGCVPNWVPGDFVAETQTNIAALGDIRVIMGFSGGVDSTVAAAMMAPVLGDRLLGVLIDAGHLREDEIEEIKAHAKAAGIRLRIIDARDTCLSLLTGVTDAEEKRRIFGNIYEFLLKEAARQFGATHICQGTLATDLIESGETGGALIKSHHNVGRKWGNLKELMPLSSFFKYEVRALAETLGLPRTVIDREPFPGPGLFIRIFGQPVTGERLDIVRWADHKVREILARSKEIYDISQLVVGLCCVKTTGVKGDGRAYESAVLVRAVTTSDFMTVEPVFFSQEDMKEISSVVTRLKGVVRVWWDFNPKPPATTEFE